MNVIIIEDETSAAQHLRDLLHAINPAIDVVVVLETIRDSIAWLGQNPSPDIAFFDIKIADGSSFEIFEKIDLDFPIVFTTAYDEYALKAFKHNGIDYLMKPIHELDLQQAIHKYQSLYANDQVIKKNNSNLISIITKLKQATTKIYKQSFLVSYRNQLIPLSVQGIAYFYLQEKLVYCVTHSNDTYTIPMTLEKIQNQVNPLHFFRANRQTIVSKKAINTVSFVEKRKLKVSVTPNHKEAIIVSKLNASDIKKWLKET